MKKNFIKALVLQATTVWLVLSLGACVIPPAVSTSTSKPPPTKPALIVRPVTLMDYFHRVNNMEDAALAIEKEKLDAGELTAGAGAILLSHKGAKFYSPGKSLNLLREFRAASSASISANEDAFLQTLESLMSERIKYSKKLTSVRTEQKNERTSLQEQQAEMQALREQNQQLKEQLEQLKQIEQNINQRIQSLEPQE